jgi:hypothetical protein
VDQSVSHVLCTRPDQQGWHEFCLGIKGHPDPHVVGFVAEGGIEFIELQMADVQVTEKVGVHFFGVVAGAGEPEAQGGVGMAKEPLDVGHR